MFVNLINWRYNENIDLSFCLTVLQKFRYKFKLNMKTLKLKFFLLLMYLYGRLPLGEVTTGKILKHIKLDLNFQNIIGRYILSPLQIYGSEHIEHRPVHWNRYRIPISNSSRINVFYQSKLLNFNRYQHYGEIRVGMALTTLFWWPLDEQWLKYNTMYTIQTHV